MSAVAVRTVDAEGARALQPRLAELLIDSVASGASVGFLHPLSVPEAQAFWTATARAVADGRCVLLVAAPAGRPVVGTVQLDIGTLPNQPHRATVSKLLVHSSARRRGVGAQLMAALERAAADAGRWLLTLDTATAEAGRLYARMGWQRAGAIPDYAMNPDGTLAATTFWWKALPGRPPAA